MQRGSEAAKGAGDRQEQRKPRGLPGRLAGCFGQTVRRWTQVWDVASRKNTEG